jgi:hypothetical protein
MDNDAAGKLGAEKISYKLGSTRSYIVKHEIPNLKDANDFLKNYRLTIFNFYLSLEQLYNMAHFPVVHCSLLFLAF